MGEQLSTSGKMKLLAFYCPSCDYAASALTSTPVYPTPLIGIPCLISPVNIKRTRTK